MIGSSNTGCRGDTCSTPAPRTTLKPWRSSRWFQMKTISQVSQHVCNNCFFPGSVDTRTVLSLRETFCSDREACRRETVADEHTVPSAANNGTSQLSSALSHFGAMTDSQSCCQPDLREHKQPANRSGWQWRKQITRDLLNTDYFIFWKQDTVSISESNTWSNCKYMSDGDRGVFKRQPKNKLERPWCDQGDYLIPKSVKSKCTFSFWHISFVQSWNFHLLSYICVLCNVLGLVVPKTGAVKSEFEKIVSVVCRCSVKSLK